MVTTTVVVLIVRDRLALETVAGVSLVSEGGMESMACEALVGLSRRA